MGWRKNWPLLLLVPTFAWYALAWWPSVMNMTGDLMTPDRPMSEVFAEAVEFAQREFDLEPLPCDPTTTLKREGFFQRCFASAIKVDEFAQRVAQKLGKDLYASDGWRDDYGLLSGGFVFRHQERYELGLSYQRRDAGIAAPTYQQLEEYSGLVRVMMSVRDE
ncbi:hypothetical protein [Deinococcus pimensis]|uniref:hypothetical protein n=1 Tax=Deinococcus pimensis TaxID=309888 RepID=UPI0004B81F84|nr:hypothetical protein [Deinococcus pimensis]